MPHASAACGGVEAGRHEPAGQAGGGRRVKAGDNGVHRRPEYDQQVAKRKRPRKWMTPLERARRALAANKRRLDAAGSTGLASEKTLSTRGYDPDPAGGGPTVPKPTGAPPPGKRKKKRRRR
ncbi:MAG: hypothetical protein ACRDLL_11625 [Solirubrobacterales bacterium]